MMICLTCRKLLLFSSLIGLCLSAAPAARGQEPQKEYASEFHESFKGLTPKNPRWGWIWPDVLALVKYEAEGVRFDLPAAPAKGRNPVGLGARLTIKGDFEITLSYEVLRETERTGAEGDASSFRLTIEIDPGPRLSAASLVRDSQSLAGSNLVAMTEVFDNAAGKRGKLNVQPFPAKAKSGRLRLVRAGADLSYLASDGDEKDFTLLAKVPFTRQDISRLSIAADNAGPKGALNVRFADLTIRADAIPQKPIAMTNINKTAPKKEAVPVVEEGPLPEPKFNVVFHADFRDGNATNPNVRTVRDANFRWASGGARVTMPAGQGKLPTTGVAANFRIKGDFEITASYEILKAEQPKEGYGVGISLFVAIDPDALHAVSLARRVGTKGGANFASDRMTPSVEKPPAEHFMKFRASKATEGVLRIVRVGSMVRFFVADGAKADFVPIYQDPKTKKIEVEFGNAEIRFFQIGADAGNSESALDVRLLDLTVQAEALPGLLEAKGAKRVVPAWILNPQAPKVEEPARPTWIIVAGGVTVVVIVAGLGAFLLLRRRQSAATEAKPAVPQGNVAKVSVVCPDCGKRLRVKAAAAGKNIKCPGCGCSVQVPKAEAIEANRN